MNEWPDQSEMIYHMPLLEEYASRYPIIWELGCGHGNGSTRAFARGLARNRSAYVSLVSVDIDPDKPDVRPVGSGHFHWAKVTGDTRRDQTAFAVFSGSLDLPDLIYIDTEHTYEHMAEELSVWYPSSNPQTIWLFHDTWMSGSYNHMTDAIKEFAESHGMKYEDITKESHGLGKMWREP